MAKAWYVDDEGLSQPLVWAVLLAIKGHLLLLRLRLHAADTR